MNKSCIFSPCRKYRYSLTREWNDSLPTVMFIGLNPSTANETTDDNTIKRVIDIAKYNSYGGVIMCNLFPKITPYPYELTTENIYINNNILSFDSLYCHDIVFAWGAFKVPELSMQAGRMIRVFPNAMALHINKDGSPKHPLYCKKDSKFIPFKY